MVVQFNDGESASVKSFVVTNKNDVTATSRFMSGKLLMFAKLSLKSFICMLTEILYFPNNIVKEIYKKYQIEKIICYHVLTDTDSTSLQFVIIFDPSSNFLESKLRDVIFEVIGKTKIYNRFDTYQSFWKKLDARKPKRKKKLGLSVVEHVDNPCYVTLAVNPKEYFDFFQDYSINEKH